jgi:hypothetical protein
MAIETQLGQKIEINWEAGAASWFQFLRSSVPGQCTSWPNASFDKGLEQTIALVAREEGAVSGWAQFRPVFDSN